MTPEGQAEEQIENVLLRQLKKYQENPRVQYVRVIVAHDCCPACREVEGAYDKERAPLLPVEACSHALGCRCSYLPFLTDIYP